MTIVRSPILFGTKSAGDLHATKFGSAEIHETMLLAAKTFEQLVHGFSAHQRVGQATHIFIKKAIELAKDINDIATAARQLGRYHDEQFKFLCEFKEARGLLKFIHNIDDFNMLLRSMDPLWKDELAGLPLDFPRHEPLYHSESGVKFDVPDLFHERAMHFRSCRVGDDLAGLLPASIQNRKQLMIVLSYIPVKLYANYVKWFAGYFKTPANLEFILKHVGIARGDKLIEALPVATLQAIYPVIESCHEKLPAKLSNLIITKCTSADDSLYGLLSSFVYTAPKKVWEMMPSILEVKGNPLTLVDVLCKSKCDEQCTLLRQLGADLFTMLTTVVTYKQVRNVLADGTELDRIMLENVSTLAQLTQSLKLIIATNPDAISRIDYLPRIPFYLYPALLVTMQRVVHNDADMKWLAAQSLEIKAVIKNLDFNVNHTKPSAGYLTFFTPDTNKQEVNETAKTVNLSMSF